MWYETRDRENQDAAAAFALSPFVAMAIACASPRVPVKGKEFAMTEQRLVSRKNEPVHGEWTGFSRFLVALR